MTDKLTDVKIFTINKEKIEKEMYSMEWDGSEFKKDFLNRKNKIDKFLDLGQHNLDNPTDK